MKSPFAAVAGSPSISPLWFSRNSGTMVSGSEEKWDHRIVSYLLHSILSYRIVWYRIPFYRMVSYRIVSYLAISSSSELRLTLIQMLILIFNSIYLLYLFPTAKFDYFTNQDKLHKLHDTVTDDNYIISSSVNSWYEEYITWAKNNKPAHYFDQSKGLLYTSNKDICALA